MNKINCFLILAISLMSVNSVNAQTFSGLEHIVIPYDAKSTIRRLKRDSEEGNDVATHLLASHYMVGLEVDQDVDQAVLLYEKAAKNGFHYSQVAMLGVLLSVGSYYIDPNDVISNLKKASETGSPAAFLGLNVMYSHQANPDRDMTLAFDYLRKAAEMPLIDVSKKPKKYKDYIANNDVISVSRYGLGGVTAVADGPGPIKLVSRMRREIKSFANRLKNLYPIVEYMFKRTENQAIILARHRIAVAYETGKYGIEKDHKKALEWYKKAAELEYPPSYAAIGYYHENGLGVEKNVNTAMEYYELGADLDNPQSMYYIGKLYENGEGVKQNAKTAVKWYKKALKENSNHAPSNNALGVSMLTGNGIKKDVKRAYQLLQMAAQKRNGSAMGNIADMYINGIHFEQDYSKAIEWMEKAAKVGHMPSITELASYYQEGELFAKDLKKSYMWYSIAAELGNQEAVEKLNALDQMLSEEDIIASKKMAQDWKKEIST